VIVQIGACSFTFEDGVDKEFLVNVDPIDCLKYGLHVETSTVEWWKTQPKEVQDSWKVAPKPLNEALTHLNNFIGTDKEQFLWSHGAVFDLGVIRSAFEKCAIKRNWPYWVECDNRTIFNMLGVRNDKIRKAQSSHHNALADAISQAETLISLFKS